MTTATAQAGAATPSPKPWILWTGRVLSALSTLMLLASGLMKLSGKPEITDQFVKLGFQPSAIPTIAALEIACVILYAIPHTAVLGAVLITGYLGGAVVTHLRLGEPFVSALVPGILVWAGIYLR